MSSVQAQFAQPKTKTLIAFAGGWLRQESTMVAAAQADPNLSVVGNVYTFSTKAHFITFVGSSAGGDSVTVVSTQTLVDLGSELHFGLAGVDSSLITMRKVKLSDVTTPADDYLDGVGYVVTENRVSKDVLDGVEHNLQVKVARV